jgi:hypothetical protein
MRARWQLLRTLMPLSRLVALGLLDALLGVASYHAARWILREPCTGSVTALVLVISAWVERLHL